MHEHILKGQFTQKICHSLLSLTSLQIWTFYCAEFLRMLVIKQFKLFLTLILWTYVQQMKETNKILERQG